MPASPTPFQPSSIAAREACFRLLVESIEEHALYTLDLEGRVASWNAGAQRMTGYGTEAVLGQPCAMFYTNPQDPILRPLLAAIQAGDTDRFEYEGWQQRRDGSRFYAKVVIVPLRDEAGVVQGFGKLTRDISTRQHMEDRFQRLVEYSPCAIVMVNPAGQIEMVNALTERLFGYARQEILGQPVEVLLPLRLRGHHPALRHAFFVSPSPRPMGAGRDLYALRKDGTEFPVEIGLTPVETDTGTMVLSMIVDISERKRLEQRFRQVVQEAPSAMVLIDERGRIVLFNRQAELTFGYQHAEVLGQAIEVLVPERFRKAHPGLRRGFLGQPEARPMGVGRDLYGLRKDGIEFPVEIGLNPLLTEEGSMVLAAIVDITARRSTQQQLESALREKTMLLNEVHHRVKNNLQVIISLLNMQANAVVDERSRSVLYDSQSRVRSMALMHQLLYERHDFSRIDLGEYLERFGKLLHGSFGALARAITLTLNVPPMRVAIELQRATPCGLLINELVTNAFKHAYPAGSGKVLVELARLDDNRARLRVVDWGVGLPDATRLKHAKTLGLQLVPILAEQMGATLTVGANEPGTCFEVVFPVMPEEPVP